MHLRVDDDEVVEALRQPLLGAQEVDGVADRPVLGRDHHLALHQAAGRIFVVAAASARPRRGRRRRARAGCAPAAAPPCPRRGRRRRRSRDPAPPARGPASGSSATISSRTPSSSSERTAPSSSSPQSAISAARSGRLICSSRSATSASCSGSSSATSASWSPASTAASTASTVVVGRRLVLAGGFRGRLARPRLPARLLLRLGHARLRGPGIARRPYTLAPTGESRAPRISGNAVDTPGHRTALDRASPDAARWRSTPERSPAIARARLTIDLDAVAANWRALDALTGPAVETAAVVKADAYGLGAARVAPGPRRRRRPELLRRARRGGRGAARGARPRPGDLRLRRPDAGRRRPRPRPRPRPVPQQPAARSLTSPAISPDRPCARAARQRHEPPRPRRRPTSPTRCRPPRAAARPVLAISHLACADAPGHPMNRAPGREPSRRSPRRLPGARRSLAATGGILLGPGFHFDLVRPGVGLYGGLPFAGARPVVRLALPVVQVRDVGAGEPVGYGAAWTAVRPSRIATVVGRLRRRPRPRARPRRVSRSSPARPPCPLVGRVSMDLITVDVTGLDRRARNPRHPQRSPGRRRPRRRRRHHRLRDPHQPWPPLRTRLQGPAQRARSPHDPPPPRPGLSRLDRPLDARPARRRPGG